MKKRTLAVVLAITVFAAMGLTACGSTSSSDATDTTTETAQVTEESTEAEATSAEVETDAAVAPDAAAGFQEHSIVENMTAGFINVNAVWFQAVPMSAGNGDTTYTDISDKNIHIEADVSANENSLGYGVGDWIPYLSIDYVIADADGNEVTSGSFMPMAASDGPHYGQNISLEAGSYHVTFSISSPGEAGYLIHTDSETGPGGSLDDYWPDGEPLTVEFDWDFEGYEE